MRCCFGDVETEGLGEDRKNVWMSGAARSHDLGGGAEDVAEVAELGVEGGEGAAAGVRGNEGIRRVRSPRKN